MGIFSNKNQLLKEGQYWAEMLDMDWAQTKAGDDMLVVEFFLTNKGKTGKALFPQVNEFFRSEAQRACEILLGVADPENLDAFFMLVGKAKGSHFVLEVTNHQKISGEITQNFLVRPGVAPWTDTAFLKPINRRSELMDASSKKHNRKAEDKAFAPSWIEQEGV